MLQCLGPPLAPVATLDSVGSSWLFLTWQLAAESNPPVSSYRLLYKLSFQNTFSELEVPYQFYNLTGLYPNAQYVVQVSTSSKMNGVIVLSVCAMTRAHSMDYQ